jgi:hypothetical protein
MSVDEAERGFWPSSIPPSITVGLCSWGFYDCSVFFGDEGALSSHLLCILALYCNAPNKRGEIGL